MSELIWTPDQGAPKPRRNVQISGQERVCVLIHSQTKRILCFARDDWFADSFADKGYEKIPLHHAHEYDRYAKMMRIQAQEENQQEEYKRLCREDVVRKRLRGDLRSRLDTAQPHERFAIEQALRTLDAIQARKQRYHDSFMLLEGYDEGGTKDVGGELAKKIISNA